LISPVSLFRSVSCPLLSSARSITHLITILLPAIMRGLTVSCLLLALAASAMARELQQSGDFYILLEDGTRMTYGDLRAMSQNKVRGRCLIVDVGVYDHRSGA
jgi:hypothetical protein